MKYYYKTIDFAHRKTCIEYCPYNMIHYGTTTTIGYYICKNECVHIINYDNINMYIECKLINNTERLKKLNTI